LDPNWLRHSTELFDPESGIKPHWRYLQSTINALGSPGLKQRDRDLRRVLAAEGCIQNTQANGYTGHNWEVDPIPWIISSQEWSHLESGLLQRAELFNHILADIYGSRRLLRQGTIPAEAIFQSASYLRCAISSKPAHLPWLNLYGVDIARGKDKQFYVMRDHLDSMPGMGYTLMFRVALARIMPSIFRESHPHRLRPFFQTLRHHLAKLAGKSTDDCRTVLLSDGINSLDYIEQTYLAHYLGYQMVESQDLSAGEQHLLLHTVAEKQAVDVIMRYSSYLFSDPLEINRASTYGIPGLMHLIRMGKITLANTLGVGIGEHPILLAYLPQLCRVLLGEELRIPSIGTWWCGDPAHLDYVLGHLDDLNVYSLRTIPPTLVPSSHSSIIPRHVLIEKIRRFPFLYLAQDQFQRSRLPAWIDNDIQVQDVQFRTFVTASGSSYEVMPGGLGYCAPSNTTEKIWRGQYGRAKDIWIAASEPEIELGIVSASLRPFPFPRSENVIPRHIADDLFWFGRYLERALMQSRTFREALQRQFEWSTPKLDPVLPGLFHFGRTSFNPFESVASQIKTLMGSHYIESLPFNLAAMKWSSRSLRDRCHSETWQLLGRLENTTSQNTDTFALLQSFDELALALLALRALTLEGMQRDRGRLFLEFGLRLERSLQILGMLRLIPELEPSVPTMVETIFQLAGVNPRQYQRFYTKDHLLQLLAFEWQNPHSLNGQLVIMEQILTELMAPCMPSLKHTQAQRHLMHTRSILDNIGTQPFDNHEEFHAWIDLLEKGLCECANEFAQILLRPLIHPRQLTVNT